MTREEALLLMRRRWGKYGAVAEHLAGECYLGRFAPDEVVKIVGMGNPHMGDDRPSANWVSVELGTGRTWEEAVAAMHSNPDLPRWAARVAKLSGKMVEDADGLNTEEART